MKSKLTVFEKSLIYSCVENIITLIVIAIICDKGSAWYNFWMWSYLISVPLIIGYFVGVNWYTKKYIGKSFKDIFNDIYDEPTDPVSTIYRMIRSKFTTLYHA